MVYQTLMIQKTGNVATVTLKRVLDYPSRVRLSDELREVCEDIGGDRETRVVIVTDAGEKSFSIKTESVQLPRDDESLPGKCFLASPVADIEVPTIAAIQGDAVGQGLELILACDLRISSENAFFGFPEIREGLLPRDGGTQRLARLVGKGRALEMILTGETIDAREALRIGLVSKIVQPDVLMTTAMGVAQEMASKGPIALKYTKEAVYKGMDMTLEQGLRLEADLYLLLHTTKDRTEGIQAFREKKAPKFEGR